MVQTLHINVLMLGNSIRSCFLPIDAKFVIIFIAKQEGHHARWN